MVSLILNKQIICPHCEKANDKEKTFCVSCGGKLQDKNDIVEAQLYAEVEPSEELHEILTSEPKADTHESRTIESRIIDPRRFSITGIVGLIMAIISITLSIWLLWLQDVTLRFYNPSNLVSYFYRANSIYAVLLVFTIVGLVLSTSSLKKNLGFSIAGFVLGTLALAPQLLKILAVGYYDVVELLRQHYPAYDYYIWEPWLITAFIFLIIAFSVSARYFKKVLLLYDKRKGKIILQSILWPLVGLIALASAYLIYRAVMHFIDLFF